MMLLIGRIKKPVKRTEPAVFPANAFTLIELLTVIIIISVLMFLSVPRLSTTAHSFYFRNKAKRLEVLFRYLKQVSMLENRIYKFRLNQKKDKYEVYHQDETEYSGYNKKIESILKQEKLDEKFNFKINGESEILFYPQGKITSVSIDIYGSKNRFAQIKTTLSGEIILEFNNEKK